MTTRTDPNPAAARRCFAAAVAAATLLLSTPGAAQNTRPAQPEQAGGVFGLARLSPASRECVDCHKKEDPAIYRTWGDSRHYSANIGCFECHGSERNAPGAFLHYDHFISTVVSPRVCARCHPTQVEEFSASLHASAARIAGSPALLHAEMAEGAPTLKTPAFAGGASPTLTACLSCHGSTVRVLPGGRLDPATWPNAGIGRVNPDGSTGACASCHTPHTFSAADARLPETCGKCHTGGASDVYRDSRHAVAFHAGLDKMNIASPKWILGEDYAAAPTCATCHMGATPNQPATHNVGARLSWNNRPEVSVRPEGVEERLGLPGQRISWQARREAMQDVCLTCHSRQWVDNFYTRYDASIDLYHDKFARPARELYALARPLTNPTRFSNKLDLTYYELWAVDGRRARQAAAMASPIQAKSASYNLAKRFYHEFIPDLERLVEAGLGSGDREKIAAAEALRARVQSVLSSDYHRWYLGRIDPDLAARHARQAEEFRGRYPEGNPPRP